MFRRILIAATCAASLAVAAPAMASASNHGCNVVFGQVTASGNTSCSFANTIMSTWHRGQCWRYRSCSGTAHSYVTGRTYSLYCERFGNSSYSHDICRTSGNDSWIRFLWVT